MKKHRFIYPLIALIIAFSGCAKDGKTGPAGANGNANVQSSTFTNQGFAYVSANNDYEINMSVAAITQTVLDRGSMMVYLQAASATNGWVALPASIAGVELNVAFYLGSAQVVSTVASSGLFNLRVVVIPPSARIKNPNVNWKNYEEVKEIFNLKD